MDKDRSGYVTKNEFTLFLGFQPQLRSVFLKGSTSQPSRAGDAQIEEARHWRQVMRTWKMLTGGNTENLDWPRFVDFFRERDMLLEYKIKDNPRERLADMLAGIHTQPQEQAGETLDEFMHLRKVHLQGQQRHELGRTEATDALVKLHTRSVGEDLPPKPMSSRSTRRGNALRRISQSAVPADRPAGFAT
jgi:hypothetical protein